MKLEKKTLADEPIFDRDAALARLGGDEALLKEVCEIFLGDYAAQTNEIEKALSASDFTQVKRGFHSLKGAAANIGAERLSKLAAALEQQASENDKSGVIENLEFFRDCSKGLSEELKKFLVD